jgi:hypothetical protein
MLTGVSGRQAIPARRLDRLRYRDLGSYTRPNPLMVMDAVMQGRSGPQLAIHFSALRPEMKVLYVSTHPDDAVVYHRCLGPRTGVPAEAILARDIDSKSVRLLGQRIACEGKRSLLELTA